MLKIHSPWLGIVFPLGLTAIGILCIATQTAWITGRGGSLTLHGLPGIIMGLMFLTWALGLHLRHVWVALRRYTEFFDLIGMLAYLSAVGLALYLLWLIIAATLL